MKQIKCETNKGTPDLIYKTYTALLDLLWLCLSVSLVLILCLERFHDGSIAHPRMCLMSLAEDLANTTWLPQHPCESRVMKNKDEPIA